MNVTINMTNWRARFSELNTLIHQIICVKTNYPVTVKNYNGAVVTRKQCMTQTEPTTTSIKNI